ncbi:hypothetical protein ONS95_011711 [Cadophora gregata]|uniref:uncharacterized protein n=1 Tax=Cadophora gregata TaxID=51156 RepID=UPI0026DAD3CB|nr:uncharacterized protein ONS95_011711 [Cadophora gregata]KAK0120305.1 hypothetical protein ONS95_011711 [Cadophora gregata]KAK0121338.1 hypothetical protein ONS96_011513 [Cadophora gregata f. sp. sojae]
MPNSTSTLPLKDTPMTDVDNNKSQPVVIRDEPCVAVSNANLTEHVDTIIFQELLIAGTTNPLKQLSRDPEHLERMSSATAIQRLIWTPIAKWHDLKKLSKHNAGLRVAFLKENAALLCNFVIKTRYPEQAMYLGLDPSASLSSKWLTPSGPQLASLRNSEHKWWSLVIHSQGLTGTEHLYEPGVSFMEPGPALLFGLEMGIVMIIKDVETGVSAGAIREDVVIACLSALTRPWYVKPKAHGKIFTPRLESGAITWYYDQDPSGREGSVKRLQEILDRAEDREHMNFEGKEFK